VVTRSKRLLATEFLDKIKTLNLPEEENLLLLNMLGINELGEINEFGPWEKATRTELKVILAAFFYRLEKGNWETEKVRAEQVLFSEKQEEKKSLTDKELSFKTLDSLLVYTDGASRGNPGDAGIGVVVYDEKGNLIQEVGKYLGKTTNNVAEYSALIEGIKIAKDFKAKKVKFFLDSELVVKQIKGIYKVKNKNLLSLYNQVIDQLKQFEQFTIEHVPREQNKKADQLANAGIDSFVKK